MFDEASLSRIVKLQDCLVKINALLKQWFAEILQTSNHKIPVILVLNYTKISISFKIIGYFWHQTLNGLEKDACWN